MKIPGGTKSTLAENAIFASRYTFEPAKTSEPMVDSRCASCLYFTQGKGRLIFGNKEEVNRFTPPSIPVGSGDTLLIPNGSYYAFSAEGPVPLELSEQKIPFAVSFI